MFGLTGARVQSQSEQIWMYNRYEIVMEYAKRPRLPPPFVVISYISSFFFFFLKRISRVLFSGMLISNGSRQCVLKLKEFADKRANNNNPNHRNSNDDDNDQSDDRSNLNIDASGSQLNQANDRSLLRQLLNCPPCKQVTNKHDQKIVCITRNSRTLNEISFVCRKKQNVIGKIVKQICIGNTRLLNSIIKLRKLIKFKKNSII